MKFLLFILLISVTSTTFSQKKIIDHTVYNDWKSLSKSTISANGNYVSFEINPHRGDGYLYFVNTQTMKRDSFFRAKNAQFSEDETFAVFTISAPFDTLRNLELTKVDKKKWPKDTLVVYFMATDSIQKFANIKSHRLNAENGIVSYLETENKLPEDVAVKKEKKCFLKKKKAEVKEPKSDGTVLRIWNPNGNNELQRKNITDYELSKNGKRAVLVSNMNDTNRLIIYDFDAKSFHDIEDTFSAIKSITFNEKQDQLAFLSSKDTVKAKNFSLQLFDFNSKTTTQLADTTTLIFPSGKSVSENGRLLFSKNDELLYFGVGNRPKAETKDSLLDSEKPKLDIWTYSENRLQAEQLYHLSRDKKSTDDYVYHFNDKKIVGLSNDTLSVQINSESDATHLLGTSNEAYSLAYQWDMSDKQDIYLIAKSDGSSKLVEKEVRYFAPLSQKGDYFIWYDFDKKQYYGKDLSTDKKTCITCKETGVIWDTDVNGMPMDAYPEGFFGWSKDGKTAYLKSKYDLYDFEIESQSLSCVTKHIGKNNKIELSPRKWENDSNFVDKSNLYFIGFDTKTKGSHLFHFDTDLELVKATYRDEQFVELDKALKSDKLIVRSMTVSKYPDIEVTDLSFNATTQVSFTNPNQSEYNWASVELVSWKSYDGIELEGLLYKPENFDAAKSYPMIVYFYELYSDKLHSYYSPKPTASIVFPTEYASAGYFMFIPDIRYKSGYPAQSAYDCILSGTDAMLKKYPQIDSTRMGLQGQSWGGYQTAQLITMTTRYRAAMAGAPVSNMFSAYGGIRWGSGLNRQFQYEKTQSRIGKTIWEAPELYVENSPLFHLPNVKTPLLIMHNDGDGAVPWYQGIELFTAMRRLGKPCWLLNYNDDDHNLMKNANRIDLSIRMRQFFDFYLNGQSSPSWLEKGIPAVLKGEELRYETH